MTEQELELATQMLGAVLEVLEARDIPSKYYTEHLGRLMDEQAVSILEQEREAI
jgi:hypothetical protein